MKETVSAGGMFMNYSAIILCAGSGSRTQLGYNKMFLRIADETVYEKTMKVFLQDVCCKQIIVVCKAEEQSAFQSLLQDDRIIYTAGGQERQDSVLSGLQLVSEDHVLIHDGARPFVKPALIHDLLSCLKQHDACLLMVPCVDTIKQVMDGKVVKTLKRSELMQAQTPQAFQTQLILQAYQDAKRDHVVATDDASLAEYYHHEVYVVSGDYDNLKITSAEDVKKITGS